MVVEARRVTTGVSPGKAAFSLGAGYSEPGAVFRGSGSLSWDGVRGHSGAPVGNVDIGPCHHVAGVAFHLEGVVHPFEDFWPIAQLGVMPSQVGAGVIAVGVEFQGPLKVW